MDCNASNGGIPNDIHNMQSLTEIYYSSHSINYIPCRIIHFLISIYPLILKKLSSIPVLLYVGCWAGYSKSPGNSRQLTSWHRNGLENIPKHFHKSYSLKVSPTILWRHTFWLCRCGIMICSMHVVELSYEWSLITFALTRTWPVQDHGHCLTSGIRYSLENGSEFSVCCRKVENAIIIFRVSWTKPIAVRLNHHFH